MKLRILLPALAWLSLGGLSLGGVGLASNALAQPEAERPANEAPRREEPAAPTAPAPFGANLFTGNYAAQREDGLNPEYRILPGDRVMVNAWGAVAINDVFAVDTQGNIFLPGIGPVHLEGVRNAELTDTVRGAIGRVYRGTVGVYTNLLTASPVAVFVTGGVPRPGRYAGIPSDSVLFFLDQAGGIDPEAGSYRDIRVLRQGSPIAELDLYDFLLRGQIASPQLSDGDIVLVGRRGPTVEVRRPSAPPMTVELQAAEVPGSELLAIVSRGARVNAVTIRGVHDGQPTIRTFPAAELETVSVRDGDILSFREDEQPDTIVVRLEGEYQGPAEIAVRRGTRLLDLLNHVPVDPALSQTDAIYIRRARVAAEQRRALQDSLDRLERTAMLALSDTASESEIRVREAELIRQFADRARNIQPLGRMVTTSGGRELNVLLEEADVIVIPARTNTVRIVGEVQMPHAVQYRPDLSILDYVQMAGGYSPRAHIGRFIVLRANAEISVGGTHEPVRPGDEVIVPPAIDDKFLQNGIDLAQVIYQIAVAASVVLRPF
jgi:protein involved in polysaccharide export with SLBB domain